MNAAVGSELDRVVALERELEDAKQAMYAAENAVANLEQEQIGLWVGPNSYEQPFVQVEACTHMSREEIDKARKMAEQVYDVRAKVYREAREKHGLAELDDAHGKAEVRYWEALTEFSQAVPTSLEGVAAKVKRLDPGNESVGVDDEVARTALEGIARLSGVPALPGEIGDEQLFASTTALHDAYKAAKTAGLGNELWDQCGKIAVEVFATPARTAKGVIEKLKIVRIAVGDNADDGDDALEAYQGPDALWMDNVIADLERQAGGAAMTAHTEANGPASSGVAPVPSEAAIAAQDPHIKWWVERQAWMAADRQYDHTVSVEAAERIGEIDNRITDTIPRTLEGLVVQLSNMSSLICPVSSLPPIPGWRGLHALVGGRR